MEKIKVHVVYEHSGDRLPHGCSYIRLLLPLSHPSVTNRIDLSSDTDYASADVIILERLLHPEADLSQAENLLKRARSDRAKVIYSIDDNLLDLESIPLNRRLIGRLLTREADGVLVSTENLKHRLLTLNENIAVVANFLDERLFTGLIDGTISENESGRKPTVIGYMGTFTHDNDLMMVLQPLREVLNRYGDRVEFQLVGGLSNSNLIRAFDGLPFRVHYVPVADMNYPNFVNWMLINLRWDIGIAPLVDNPINRSKSDVKFLDYSAIGAASICSRADAYDGSVVSSETGLLLDAGPDLWVEALDLLINEGEFRKRLQQASREYVATQRTLKVSAYKWLDAIKLMIS